MTFDIYPAIDLRRGRVVRLQMGDPSRQTVYGDNPSGVARRWLDAGATWLHVVNLDGAFSDGGRENWASLKDLTQLGTRIQFGGGLRQMSDIETAVDLGVSRVVLGTAAMENPGLVSEAIGRFGTERVAVGIDARDRQVRIHGWQNTTDVSPAELASSMHELGVRTAIFTDISRDGVLSGVNIEATVNLASSSDMSIIASGGVSTLDDVVRLTAVASAGVTGVIIGRALYEGQVDLASAIAVAASGGSYAR